MVNDMTRASLRRAGEKAINLFAEVYDGPEENKVNPACDRETIRRMFAGTIGDEGVGIEATVDDFARLVLPNSMRTAHPLYLGLVNTSPLPAAVLADLLVSTLNNNGGAFHQGPAMWGAEQEVLTEFASLLRTPDACGMFVPGGSYANLHALLLARSAKFPEWSRSGPASVKGMPILYTSDASHFSVARAAMAMGTGKEGVVTIPTMKRGVLDVAALADRVAQDCRAGHKPFAVVAVAGTTGTGAIDPISAIADLCRDEDLWLHVDACYGGGALLLDEMRHHFDGIERADSISIDPHKWFFIPMTAAIVFTRHPQQEQEAFDMPVSYIPSDGQVDGYRRGIATSRRCSGLTVWMALRAHGWNTIRDAVRRNIALSRLLEKLLGEQGFAILPDGILSITCARWEPPGWDQDEVDRLQGEIAREIAKRGDAWFATVIHEDKTWLRFNILNLHTRERHLQKLVQLVLEVATNLDNSSGRRTHRSKRFE